MAGSNSLTTISTFRFRFCSLTRSLSLSHDKLNEWQRVVVCLFVLHSRCSLFIRSTLACLRIEWSMKGFFFAVVIVFQCIGKPGHEFCFVGMAAAVAVAATFVTAIAAVCIFRVFDLAAECT